MGTKEAVEVAAKQGSKSAGKVVPVISLGFAAASIGLRWANPKNRETPGKILYNSVMSVAELGSGIAGCFPGVGTVVSIGMDVAIAGADIGVAVHESCSESAKE